LPLFFSQKILLPRPTMQNIFKIKPERLNAALSVSSAVLLVIALLLYLQPYYGIRHDSVLYLGQALLRWKPAQFSNDLFFAYGSQAQFTLFPQVIAWMLNHANAATLFLAMTLVGRVFFAAASFLLLHQLLPPKFRLWALLSLLIMPTNYGGFNVFSYAEPFSTGRTFAEPLILLALAAFVRQRWLATCTLWVLAAVIHPLQAFPALVLAWLWLINKDKRWLHLLWLPVAGLLLALANIPPFSTLLTQFDQLWLEWVSEANKHVFIMHWPWPSWCYLLTDLFLVWSLMKFTRGTINKFCSILLQATALGFACSALFADWLQLVWPTGLQIWRIQWLLHWLAMAGIPFLLFRLYRRGHAERPRLLLLVAIAVIGVTPNQAVPPWAVLITIPMFLLWPHIRERISPKISRLLMGAIVLSLAIACARYWWDVFNKYKLHDNNWYRFRLDLAILSFPLITGSFTIAGIRFWHRSQHLVRYLLLIALTLWLAYAAIFWDRRNDWTRSLESATPSQSVFGTKIPQGSQVYWENELLAPWLILNSPSYFSGHQMSGLLFNRKTAEEAHIRSETLSILEIQTQICDIMNTLNRTNASCLIDDDAVRNACAASERRLDYLVLRNSLKAPAKGTWTAFNENNKRPVTYYLYACKDFALPRTGRRHISTQLKK